MSSGARRAYYCHSGNRQDLTERVLKVRTTTEINNQASPCSSPHRPRSPASPCGEFRGPWSLRCTRRDLSLACAKLHSALRFSERISRCKTEVNRAYLLLSPSLVAPRSRKAARQSVCDLVSCKARVTQLTICLPKARGEAGTRRPGPLSCFDASTSSVFPSASWRCDGHCDLMQWAGSNAASDAERSLRPSSARAGQARTPQREADPQSGRGGLAKRAQQNG